MCSFKSAWDPAEQTRSAETAGQEDRRYLAKREKFKPQRGRAADRMILLQTAACLNTAAKSSRARERSERAAKQR
jgi:hypothetical protein